MQTDLWNLYRMMYRSRLFEEAVARLWDAGRISGEMHMSMGEEAIAAGIVSQLIDGDAMALDHRGTAPLLMRGVDPVSLLREFLGFPDGLCAGMGGHMHLFSQDHLAASSGIVGASGPAGVGFALAAQYLRPGTVAVAFFGEGAANQGMLLESMNLAVVWNLPVLFVCKDNHWAIMTSTPEVIGGDLVQRAQAMGIPAEPVDGMDVQAVHSAASRGLERARSGGGPTFMHATCVHLEGHFLADPYLRWRRQPLKEIFQYGPPIMGALFARRGLPFCSRLKGLLDTLERIRLAVKTHDPRRGDPLLCIRKKLSADGERLRCLESEVRQEINQVVESAAVTV